MSTDFLSHDGPGFNFFTFYCILDVSDFSVFTYFFFFFQTVFSFFCLHVCLVETAESQVGRVAQLKMSAAVLDSALL